MSTSQNGWPVRTSSADLTPLPWVTGRVVPGDVYAVFDYLCRRFDREVENIDPKSSWGYAYRAVRGQTSGFSNHASGTAIDLNAPRHPLGRSGTFTLAQATAIRRILADLDGVIRWGGNYSGRKDEMHFEINASAADVKRAAQKVSAPMTPPKPPTYPRPPAGTVVAWNCKVGSRPHFDAELETLAGRRVIGLMETGGHRDDIRKFAIKHGYSIVSGSGDTGASSQLLVKHRSGVVASGVVTIGTPWRGPKGKRIDGRAFPWVKLDVDGRKTLVILVHMPWGPTKPSNVRAWVACSRVLRRLAKINPGWDVLIVGDLNQPASSRLPYSILGTANKIGGRIVSTGAPLDYAIYRRSTTPRPSGRPVVARGRKGSKLGSDHPVVTYSIGA